MRRNWYVAIIYVMSQSSYIIQKIVRTAANLTSCLLANYAATKLETIIDRELEISHESFASQMESRLGSGEGDTAKGPDMKVWNKGRNLNEACTSSVS